MWFPKITGTNKWGLERLYRSAWHSPIQKGQNLLSQANFIHRHSNYTNDYYSSYISLPPKLSSNFCCLHFFLLFLFFAFSYYHPYYYHISVAHEILDVSQEVHGGAMGHSTCHFKLPFRVHLLRDVSFNNYHDNVFHCWYYWLLMVKPNLKIIIMLEFLMQMLDIVNI